jgi:hypothetical protein
MLCLLLLLLCCVDESKKSVTKVNDEKHRGNTVSRVVLCVFCVVMNDQTHNTDSAPARL